MGRIHRVKYLNLDTICDRFQISSALLRRVEEELCEIYQYRREQLEVKCCRIFLEASVKRACKYLKITEGAAKHVVQKRGPLPGHRKYLRENWGEAMPWPQPAATWGYCLAGCVLRVHTIFGLSTTERLSAKWCRCAYVARGDVDWMTCYMKDSTERCRNLAIHIIQEVEQSQRTSRGQGVNDEHASAMDAVLGLPPLETKARPNPAMLAGIVNMKSV
jgi:hypothetical protein